jgi:hypothetical protein
MIRPKTNLHAEDADAGPPTTRTATLRAKTNAWLDETITRRKFLPAWIVLVVAIAGAFHLLNQTRSDVSADRQVDLALERCTAAVARTEGLRFNLNEIYDVLDVVVLELETVYQANEPIVGMPEAISRLEERIATGRSEIDDRYPQRTTNECVTFTVTPVVD